MNKDFEKWRDEKWPISVVGSNDYKSGANAAYEWCSDNMWTAKQMRNRTRQVENRDRKITAQQAIIDKLKGALEAVQIFLDSINESEGAYEIQSILREVEEMEK